MTQPLDMEMLSLNLVGLVNAKRFMAQGGLFTSQTNGAADLIYSTNSDDDSSAVCGKDEEGTSRVTKVSALPDSYSICSTWIPILPEPTHKTSSNVHISLDITYSWQ